jgi:hypothetical protein
MKHMRDFGCVSRGLGGTLVLLIFLVMSPLTAKADSFFIYEQNSAGTDCGAELKSSPVNFAGLTCGSSPNQIAGSARSGDLYLGAKIDGGTTQLGIFGGTVGANFDMLLQEDQLATSISGQKITFFWAMEGLISVAGDGNKVGLSVVSRVNGVLVVNPAIPYVTDFTGFYSNVLGSTPVQGISSGKYDIYLGFNNSVVGEASSNFYGTLRLSEISVTDQAGRPIDGVTFTDSFGDVIAANRPLQDATVPEPSTLNLLLMIAPLIGYKLRTRSRRKL